MRQLSILLFTSGAPMGSEAPMWRYIDLQVCRGNGYRPEACDDERAALDKGPASPFAGMRF